MGNWTKEERPKMYVECVCDDPNHVTRFCWWAYETDPDPYWHSLSLETQLNLKWPWWRRLWLAIRYVFGMQCKYGHWNQAELDEDGVKQLRVICDEFLEDREQLRKEGKIP